MQPIPIKLPPGFFRNGTEYESAGRWYDGNLVRWENGRLKPWQGWRRVLSGGGALTGKARGSLAWTSNVGYRYATIGTHQKLYVSSDGAVYSDATPAAFVTGRPDGIAGPGWGAGPYGRELYGRARTANAIALDATTWSFDVYGEDLLAVCTSDGRIVRWQPSIGGVAAVLAGAPTGNVGVLVTDETYIFALGAGGNHKKVQWNDTATGATAWTPGALSTAGSRTLKTTGRIVTGRLWNSQPLVWTTTDVHAFTYLGPPLYYSNNRISETGGLIGTNAVNANTERLAWMGLGKFFTYDGIVRVLDCDVLDYVFSTTNGNPGINLLQAAKVCCWHNSFNREFVWFYADAASTENNRYVTWNYGMNIWYFGQLERTTWIDRGVFSLPVATDASGVIWEHDYGGYLADGVARSTIFAQSGPAEIGSGERVIYSNSMLPDTVNGSSIQMRLLTRQGPQGTQTTFGPYDLTPNTEGRVPVRFTGRQASIKLTQIADTDWSIGNIRMDIAGGGRR